MCISSVLGELGGETKNLKSAVINLKDNIMKMKAGKDRDLGKQVEGKMENAFVPDNNRNKSIDNGTEGSEL